METIKFNFTINKVQNLAAGGYRVSLDIPSLNAKEAAMLLVYADATGVVGNAELALSKNNNEKEIDYGL